MFSCNNTAYRISKAKAEQAAWDFVKQQREQGTIDIDLTVINPFLIIGPIFPVHDNVSEQVLKAEQVAASPLIILNYLLGKATANTATICLCDVRDVANAHILAVEHSAQAKGNRYIICAETTTNQRVAKKLATLFPTMQVKVDEELQQAEPKALLDSSRSVKDLQLKYTSLDDTFSAMVKSFQAMGLVPK